MAAIVNGTNATIATDKLEEMTYALIEFGQAGEDNTTNNPKNVTNLTSTINRDEKRINAVFNAPCAIAVSATGQLTITVDDYLTDITFSHGEGSSLKATNWAAALVECIILQSELERDPAKNTVGTNYITWGVNMADPATIASNAVFAAALNLPLAIAPSGNGGYTYKGAVYLK